MQPEIQVLDRGYVKLIDVMGSDESIIEAARMSTNKGFQNWEEDAKLLSFLYKNKHMTPFEMCDAVFEIKAPIFVFREWHRHRTQSYNEMSARYIPLPNENYVPDAIDIEARSGVNANKQASGTQKCSYREAAVWLSQLQKAYEIAEEVYEEGIRLGVPKELARLPVPVARYSRMRAKANLRNWLQFLELRDAPNAQKEIRLYAEVVNELLSAHFPRTLALFNEGRK